MSSWLGASALGASALQALLMGMIGYPIAVSRRRGLETFHRSGFAWWIITLVVLVATALLSSPGVLSPKHPSASGTSLVSIVIFGVVGAGAALFVEVAANVLRRRASSPDRGSERYEDALPEWARVPAIELGLLASLAVLEELAYRCLGLGWLVRDLGLPSVVGVTVAAMAFGVAHWYYGLRQIVLKTLLGLVFGSTAILGGWPAAALAHLLLNVLLIELNRWSRGRAR